MYTRVFVVAFVAILVQTGQYSAAQSLESAATTESSQFDNEGLGSGLNLSEDVLVLNSGLQPDTVSASLFESSLSSSPSDIARKSDAQQRVVLGAFQFLGAGLLLVVGVIAGTIFYMRRTVTDQFGTPLGRRSDRNDW